MDGIVWFRSKLKLKKDFTFRDLGLVLELQMSLSFFFFLSWYSPACLQCFADTQSQNPLEPFSCFFGFEKPADFGVGSVTHYCPLWCHKIKQNLHDSEKTS